VANKQKCFYCSKEQLVSKGRYYGESDRVFICSSCWDDIARDDQSLTKYDADTTAYLFNLKSVLLSLHDEIVDEEDVAPIEEKEIIPC
jgi:hypothetical protein